MKVLQVFQRDYKKWMEDNDLRFDGKTLTQYDVTHSVNDNAAMLLRGGHNAKEDFNIRVGKRIDKQLKEYFYGI